MRDYGGCRPCFRCLHYGSDDAHTARRTRLHKQIFSRHRKDRRRLNGSVSTFAISQITIAYEHLRSNATHERPPGRSKIILPAASLVSNLLPMYPDVEPSLCGQTMANSHVSLVDTARASERWTLPDNRSENITSDTECHGPGRQDLASPDRSRVPHDRNRAHRQSVARTKELGDWSEARGGKSPFIYHEPMSFDRETRAITQAPTQIRYARLFLTFHF